jgi:ABC-type lipoprotein release transport system permease subunit
LNVGGFFKLTTSQAAPVIVGYERVAELVRRELPEIDFMVARGRGWGRLVSDRGATQAVLWGTDIAADPALRHGLAIVQGRLDDLARPDAILLFEQQARKLDVRAGDAITISSTTARGVANTADLRVVAIARELGPLSAFQVFVSNAALREIYQLNTDVTGSLQIHVAKRHVHELARLAARLRQALAKAGYRTLDADPRAFFVKLQSVTRENWSGQKLDVTTWEDELSFMMWTYRTCLAASALFLLILQLITIAGVMSTLWIAIRERTREIGTLRAIGMQRRDVARLFLLEAGMLGFFGAAAGIALGVLSSSLVNALQIQVPSAARVFLLRDTLLLELEPRILLAALLSIAELTAAAAFFPSLRAARLRPIDAMARFE